MASMLAKVGGVAVTFLVIGRALGPSDLGIISVYFAYASLLALVADYGSSTFSFRALALAGDGLAGAFAEAMGFRLSMCVVIGTAGSIGLIAAGLVESSHLVIFFALLASTLAATQADFFVLLFRTMGRYDEDARVTISASLLHLLLTGTTAFLTRDIIVVALAFLLSRTLYLAYAARRARIAGVRWLAEMRKGYFAPRRIGWTLASNRYYATDTIITAAFGQVDTIIVAAFFGTYGAGIYQLGAKVISTSLAVVQVASAIYIPSLARADRDETRRLRRRMLIELTVGGLALGGGITFGMPFVVDFVFGPKFAETNILWPWIGLVIVIRCSLAAVGIALIARGQAGYRTICQTIILSSFIGLSWLVLPGFGLPLVPIAMAVALILGGIAYVICLIRADRQEAEKI